MLSVRLRSSRPRSRRGALSRHASGLRRTGKRLLLYSTLGDQWTYSDRITYSLMPDGTNVGGVPSALFQTLNASSRRQPGSSRSKRPRRSGRTSPMSIWQWFPMAASRSGPPAISKMTRDLETSASVQCRSARRYLRSHSASPRQRRHRCRRHPSQLQRQLANQLELRPDDGRGSRVWPCIGLGESTCIDGRDVRHLQRNQAGTGERRHQPASSRSTARAQFDQFNTGGQRDNTYIDRHQHQLIHEATPRSPSRAWTSRLPVISEWFYVNVPANPTGP